MAQFNAEDLRKDVNQSGFPFQKKVAHIVNSTTADHGWKVETREHAWQDSDSREGGFVDLVICHEAFIFKIIVECKRPRDGKWIFLADKGVASAHRIRTLWRHEESSGWGELYCDPASIEVSDCIVKGQDERSPMLERIAAEILQSMSAVLAQEMEISESNGGPSRVYLPMIVTAADLFVCSVDAAEDISIDGVVTEKADIAPIPFVRFRKSLAIALSESAAPRNLKEENMDKERTILVVNTRELAAILQQIKPNPVPLMPWDTIRRW